MRIIVTIVSLSLASCLIAACGGGSDDPVLMAKPLQTEAPKVVDGVLVFSNWPAPGAARAEVASLSTTVVSAKLAGCSSSSHRHGGTTGGPDFAVLVTVDGSEVAAAKAVGFQLVDGNPIYMFVDGFDCASRNL